jgi:hypothetical protein
MTALHMKTRARILLFLLLLTTVPHLWADPFLDTVGQIETAARSYYEEEGKELAARTEENRKRTEEAVKAAITAATEQVLKERLAGGPEQPAAEQTKRLLTLAETELQQRLAPYINPPALSETTGLRRVIIPRTVAPSGIRVGEATALRKNYGDGEYDRCRESLKQIQAGNLGPKAAELADLALKQLDEVAQKEQDDLFRFLEDMKTRTEAAAGSAEMEPIIKALSQAVLAQQKSNGSVPNRKHADLLSGNLEAARQWQTSLVLHQEGELRQALESLSRIDGPAVRTMPIISPAKLVETRIRLRKDLEAEEERERNAAAEEANQKAAMKEKEPEVPDLTQLKSIDQIEEFRQKFKDSGRWNDILKTLDLAYQDYRAKNYYGAITGAMAAIQDNRELTVIGKLLIQKSLLLDSGMTDPKNAPPGEPFADCVNRLMAKAVSERRWDRAMRIGSLKVEYASDFAPSPPSLASDQASLRALQAGDRMLTAGQWEKAAQLYLSSVELAASVEVMPYLREQLDKLKREHPEDYQRASASPLAPSK